MKNYYPFFIFVCFSILFLTANVLSCQPCPSTLNLQDTINNSDLIIIGQKITDIGDIQTGFSPEGMKVKVISILKGTNNKEELNIVSAHGMCGYGIYLRDNRENVLFLKKAEAGFPNYDYDAINWGCSVRSLVVENNQVEYNGQKISIDELTQNIIVKKTDNQIKNLYWIIPLIIILCIIIFLIFKKKK